MFLRLIFLLVLLCSCSKKETLSYFEKISLNDVRLETPKYGEWRYNRTEKLQTFTDFQKSKKIAPTEKRKFIYLLPIGNFSNLHNIQIEKTKEYLEAFYQLPTKVLPVVSDNKIPKSKTRILDDNNKQLNADYVLKEIVLKNKPKDAVAIMGITEKDLFPRPEWNYVFGFASYEDGAGVTSVYRFQNGNLNQNNFQKSLERLIKISSHEIGHMFGIQHCVNAVCVMNGTNHLTETDEHFARMCSLCQQKIHSTLKYNNLNRLKQLQEYFKENRMNFELSLVNKDIDALSSN